MSFKSLKSHRSPNTDLYLTQCRNHRASKIKYEWVKSHMDKRPWKSIDDLIHQKLALDEIYNVWCDRVARSTWEHGHPTFTDPEVSPQEKWAVYSDHPIKHKIIGNLRSELQSHLSFSTTSSYICMKHNLPTSIIEKINIVALGNYLQDLPFHWRASMVKLIHNWIPTFSSLCPQGRESSPVCQRCQLAVKTPEHVLICGDQKAVTYWSTILHSTLQDLLKIGTPIHVVTILEYKLSLVFNIPCMYKFRPASTLAPDLHAILLTAIHHQNLIRWDCLLKGYTSIYWNNLLLDISQSSLRSKQTPTAWDIQFISHIISLHKHIWEDRNKTLHVVSRKEAHHNERGHLINSVTLLYNNPPKLDPRYPKIMEVPYQDRIRRSSTYLRRWIHRVSYQKEISNIIWAKQ
jgi:hypothetical protein